MFEEVKVKSASVHVAGSLKVKEEKNADGNYFYRCGFDGWMTSFVWE